ncbi:50s ribosome-binding gtpase [Holotrichia oblita]|uniref:50s ribosome-binding gtpase n=1 Tax=Holotrichia oblita TaxID=644536 RepID=A0ACB9T6S2_HOLOL|nr:50s ribosome-binding gtpase [Holotrichia oblita]
MSEKEIINILLLGETGVGKSTAINAIANYLTHQELSQAAEENLLYLIPTKFTLYDNQLVQNIIEIGESPNENTGHGESATRNIQSYLLNYNQNKIRLIDTPGIADTRGMVYDEENTEKLLSYIGELDHLNAICILLKPNNSRFSVLFNYCLKHILLRLDRRTQTNIVFLFTNSRSSFYTPGDTYLPLKTMLDQMKTRNFIIPFNNSNTFCIDNESFRYLAAKSKGIFFDENDVEEFKRSWDKSADTFKRMIDYIVDLPAAPMKGVVSINESRRLIGRLGKSIIQLLTLQEKAILTLSNHEASLWATQDTFHDLVSNAYIPITHYKITECSGTYPFISCELGYRHTWTNTDYTAVTIVPYVTSVPDIGVQNAIASKKEALEMIERIINQMNLLKNEYKNESEIILEAAIRFTMFLQENALLNYQDAFENYLGQLMREEKVLDSDQKLIENLEDLIVKYRLTKSKIKNVTPEDIEESKGKLLQLKYSGNNFKELLDKKFEFQDSTIDVRMGK